MIYDFAYNFITKKVYFFFDNNQKGFIFAPCFSYICAQSYEKSYKVVNKQISFSRNERRNYFENAVSAGAGSP